MGVNASPHPGRARNGAFATIKSYSKLPSLELSNGASLELKFTPTVLAGPKAKEKLMSLFRTFVDLGGVYLNGLTVTDTAVLKEAQKYPDRHRDLTVRVWVSQPTLSPWRLITRNMLFDGKSTPFRRSLQLIWLEKTFNPNRSNGVLLQSFRMSMHGLKR